jgi:PqqD family protein of HPr-rel-A system
MTLQLSERRPVRRPDVWLRQSDDENVIYDPLTSEVHMLNATALAIWVLCDGQTTVDEMVQAVCELSGLPETVVREDLTGILGRFADSKILTWRE